MKSKEPLRIEFQLLPKEEKGGQCYNCPKPARQKVTWDGNKYFAVCCENPECEKEVLTAIERLSMV